MDHRRWSEIRKTLERDLLGNDAERDELYEQLLNEIEDELAGSRFISVVQPWIKRLPLRMQSVLLLGTRGPDTHRAPGIKKLTRWIRGLVFVPGNPANVAEFMLADPPTGIPEKSDIHRELEFTSQHYYSHLMHALEEIAYGHPAPDTANLGLKLYQDMCKIFHLPVEPEHVHHERLKQLAWPEGLQPMDGREALELIHKHDAFSERDQAVLRKIKRGEPV